MDLALPRHLNVSKQQQTSPLSLTFLSHVLQTTAVFLSGYNVECENTVNTVNTWGDMLSIYSNCVVLC